MAYHLRLKNLEVKRPTEFYPVPAQGKRFVTRCQVTSSLTARRLGGKRPAASRYCGISKRVYAVCVGFVALAVFPLVDRQTRAEDWPQWRGPRGDGTWDAPRLSSPWPPEGLRTRWKKPLGGGYAGVVVSGKRAYTMDRQVGTQQDKPHEVERILAFDLADGRLVWQHSYRVVYGNLDYGNGPRAAPTVAAGHVYTLGAMGHACCLDAETGQVVWQRDLVADAKAVIPQWGLAASPVLFQETAILHPGVPGGCYLALDRDTGHERWRCGDDPAGYATPILAAHRGRTLLVGWTPEHVVGIDPAAGALHWKVPYKVTYGVSIATPIFVPERELVLVCGYWEGSKAIRLGPRWEDAELAWEENDNLRGLMSQPLQRGELAFLLDKSHGMTCFELATGAKRWDDRHQLTPRGRNPQASLVWLGDRDEVLALNSEGELVHAQLDGAGFRERSRAKIIGPTWAHPAFAGSAVVARSDEELVCVELPVER